MSAVVLRCPTCGRFVGNVHPHPVTWGSWVTAADCNVHGQIFPLVAWDEVWTDDFDPEHA